eukprot:1265352-Pyramimonas_sp.AAC.1
MTGCDTFLAQYARGLAALGAGGRSASRADHEARECASDDVQDAWGAPEALQLRGEARATSSQHNWRGESPKTNGEATGVADDPQNGSLFAVEEMAREDIDKI